MSRELERNFFILVSDTIKKCGTLFQLPCNQAKYNLGTFMRRIKKHCLGKRTQFHVKEALKTSIKIIYSTHHFTLLSTKIHPADIIISM